jgi:hypothetical protein
MKRLAWLSTLLAIFFAGTTVHFWQQNQRLQENDAESASMVPRQEPIPVTSTQAQKSAATKSANLSGGSTDAVTKSADSESIMVRKSTDGTMQMVRKVSGVDVPLTTEEQRSVMQNVEISSVAASAKLPNGPSWSPGQAAGEPNTARAGDFSTAWASQDPDGGAEWIQLKYGKSVEISEINIHETYNPGALSKVTARMADGSEKTLWEGVEPADEAPVERAITVPPGIRSDQIKVYLDTARVAGWNEIDAVELVGRDGTRQWASESTASSYYGQGRTNSSFEYDRMGFGFIETGLIEVEPLGPRSP